MSLTHRLGLEIPEFNIRIHDEGDSTYRIESDLGKRLSAPADEVHKIFEAALLAISGLSQILLEMKAYSALNGFRDEALPLFQAKLNFLADTASSQSREDSFQRVIEIAGIPSIDGVHDKVDIQKLLKVRESPEVREFRDWLGGCASASDSEIKDAISGFKAKAGLVVSGNAGKALRFLITNGVGFVPHPAAQAAALGLSALDSFVVDKVLPRSGIAAFVNQSYPSIFETPKT